MCEGACVSFLPVAVYPKLSVCVRLVMVPSQQGPCPCTFFGWGEALTRLILPRCTRRHHPLCPQGMLIPLVSLLRPTVPGCSSRRHGTCRLRRVLCRGLRHLSTTNIGGSRLPHFLRRCVLRRLEHLSVQLS